MCNCSNLWSNWKYVLTLNIPIYTSCAELFINAADLWKYSLSCSGMLCCWPQWVKKPCDPVAADRGCPRWLVCEGIQLLWHPDQILQGRLLSSAATFSPLAHTIAPKPVFSQNTPVYLSTRASSNQPVPWSCLRLCLIIHVSDLSSESACGYNSA